MEKIILKEADLRYKHPQIDNIQAAKHQAFCEGAKWMIEYMEKNRLDACDNMTEAEYKRESEFVAEFINRNHRAPTLSDVIEEKRKEMINKSCEAFCTARGCHVPRATCLRLGTCNDYDEFNRQLNQ